MTLLAATTTSYLERNLACLGERNADVARRIREAGRPDDVLFEDTPQGVPTAIIGGRLLASRHRPLDEARRVADAVDVLNHAVVVAIGFGTGHHIARLADRMEKSGVIIVFEPNVALLRAVFERIDCSAWLARSLIVWITDPADQPSLARKLAGAEAILAQGVTWIDHPANRERIGAAGATFAETLRAFIQASKTTLLTTLVRSTDTIRNLLWNIDHYSVGPGIADLRNAAAGRLAVVVSAGPSLQRNMHMLAQPGVRDRCVIIAVQTTLKPLLASGVRPHFVTALDYHEISARFYEGLTPEDVEGVTLVADPKAHPVILDSFPGVVRCCKAGFLDRLLRQHAREMGDLPSGATVAHLAFYLAEYLGCNPIAMIGQDLGFTDGVYYARGTAIDDVWAPELNPFNTVEMMEWQRIARHRTHLTKTTDIHGKSIYTDAQMLTYLQQFERDFAAAVERGVVVIDASEGGVAKRHTVVQRLADIVPDHATTIVPVLPSAPAEPSRRAAALSRVLEMRRDVDHLRRLSTQTAEIIRSINAALDAGRKTESLFDALDARRREVDGVFEAFELLSHVNQLGVFRRQRSDRRIHLSKSLDPAARQRLHLQRDLDNVTWTADAAEELLAMLADAEAILEGDIHRWRTAATPAAPTTLAESKSAVSIVARAERRIAAVLPVDPSCCGLGVRRSIDTPFLGRPVLQATLERLGASRSIHEIVLVAPEGFDVEPCIDRDRVGKPVVIERCSGSPFGPEHQAVAAARRWAGTCWRGGIAGMSAFDEAFCPRAFAPIVRARGLSAIVCVAPEWPLVNVSEPGGIDSLIERHLSNPDRLPLVFSQAPPGLGACLVAAHLVEELAERNRLSTIGGLLVYQPHAPQGDPVARDANVQIDHRVRGSLMRATSDASRWRAATERVAARLGRDASWVDIAAALQSERAVIDARPQHLVIELNQDRSSTGLFSRSRAAGARRDPITLDFLQHVLRDCADIDDLAVTFDGAGDPMLHPQFEDCVRVAHDAGVRGIHVRTELRGTTEAIDSLLQLPVDVISVDVQADRASTYRAMMGDDGFKSVLANLDHCIQRRTRLTEHAPNAAFAQPWIVPRISRCHTTYEDIDTFFDRWQAVLGTAVIDSIDVQEGDLPPLASAAPPTSVVRRDARSVMHIRCDGAVTDTARPTAAVVAHLQRDAFEVAWRRVLEASDQQHAIPPRKALDRDR
jgi:hypothetical protein